VFPLYRYFVISLCLHLAIIASLFVNKLLQKPIVGSHLSHIAIHSYVFTDVVQKEEAISQPKTIVKITSQNTIGLALKRKEMKTSIQKKTFRPAMNRGDNIEKMLALIHAAIKAKQYYPNDALYLEKEGRVTLSFILLTNGFIENLYIKKSSGVSSLDKAAMFAAAKASPLQNVHQYLTVPQEFVIDIIYQI